LIKAIDGAKTSVEVLIFRLDRRDIEKALVKAAGRGVFVHALIASTNRGGEQNLRDLETRLLDAGVTVARTADDLVRYHGKFIIIDRRVLFLLGFNFTHADMEHSRSFGLMTSNAKLVQEAVRLFEADTKRQSYEAHNPAFLVSPVNARKQISEFLRGARKELLIYDPRISDPSIIRILDERAKAGVDVRILGHITRRSSRYQACPLAQTRLHTRTILRDRSRVFLGSQSLRALELDARREVGAIFRDSRICKTLANIFEEDWTAAAQARASENEKAPATKVAKRVAKALAKEIPPVFPVVEGAVKELVGNHAEAEIELNAEELEATVKDAVKRAVKDAVRDVVQEAVEESVEEPAATARVEGGK
jgi:phosphatidylserine/phosphatidylglycerophosphate/cardiolipin synthase-like enzyme